MRYIILLFFPEEEKMEVDLLNIVTEVRMAIKNKTTKEKLVLMAKEEEEGATS
jgi:hypothetical protein